MGGRDAKPGITVYRFANRIPLLFEGGADVATQVSKKRINWSAYKIRQNQDKVGVFVSLVSTKVPFKGTGKEYIGDDIPEVQAAVKRALERCCLQLKAKIVKQRSLADERERRKNLQSVSNLALSARNLRDMTAALGSRRLPRSLLQQRCQSDCRVTC